MNDMLYKNREDMVYNVLKNEILDLRLKPGQLIQENDICEKFRVSRTPVRNALRSLQEQGFILTVPYRGIYVKLLSLKNIKQMIYMRLAVELLILRDFISKNDKAPYEDIEYLIKKQEKIIKKKFFKPAEFYKIDAQMHEVWFEATNKKELWQFIQAQQLHYTRFRMLDFVTETDFTRIIKEHKDIFETIKAKDMSKLTEILKDHLYFSMKRMRYQINVVYKDYFEEEPEEGKFDI